MLFMGDSAVGKSFYAARIRNHNVPTVAPEVTVYADYYVLSNAVPEENGRVFFSLVDVGGTMQFDHLLSTMYRNVSVVVMFFDLTRRGTFESVRANWWPAVQKYATTAQIFILIGNKSDLEKDRQVTRVEAQQFVKAAKLDGYYEVSALCDDYDDAFRPIQVCAMLALQRLPAATDPVEKKTLALSSTPAAAGDKGDCSC